MQKKTYILYHDGKEIMTGSEFEILKYIHRHHSYSLSHALKYEGYSIEETTKINTSSR